MAALIGIGLALGVAIFARIVGLDRDRAFYPVVLIVIASYYVLFAVMGATQAELAIELAVFVLFGIFAVFGFRISLWIVVAAFAIHGVFDFLRAYVISNSGVPTWWPDFCLGYDVSAAAILAMLQLSRPRHVPPDEGALLK